ncbi:RTX-I toxin determinant A from serotypes 1/9 [Methylophilaceae bacterium]|nr:RTX-I toxin determinant A from serotypes 1/9 [Methylophilaceae bacterium]
MAIIGTVVAILGDGTASVINERGQQILLKLNDTVQPGDSIVTPRGVVVELQLVNGRKVLISAEQTVKFTEELAEAIVPTSAESAIEQATVEAVIKAIEEGRDINEVLEETAAGLNGGAADDGHGFVNLGRIEQVIDGFNFEFSRLSDSEREIAAFRDGEIEGLNSGGIASAGGSGHGATGPSNNAPVAVAESIGGLEGSPTLFGNLTATDPDGDALTFTSTGPAVAGLTINPDGSFEFDYSDPAYDYLKDGDSHIITVPFTVEDGKGGVSNSTLTITVTGTNDLPVAITTTATGDEDTNIPVTLTGTDVDGTVDFVTVTTLPLPSEGVLYLPDGVTPVVAGVPIPAADTSNLVFVPAPDYNGTVVIEFTVTDDDGGVSSPSTATIVINSVIDVTTVTLSSATDGANVTEGVGIVYTATVDRPVAGSDLVVTLSNGQTITIPVGATSADSAPYVPRPDDAYVQGSQALSVSIVGTPTGGNYESLVTAGTVTNAVVDDVDNTTVSISGSAFVTEGGVASYTVSLDSIAEADVTIILAYSGTAVNGSDFNGVATVTIPSGSNSVNFDISAIDNMLAEGTKNFTVTIGSATGGNFENLVVSGTNGSVTTSLLDNDVATVSLSATSTLTEAGGDIVYTATITEAPVSDLTVNLSNGTSILISAGMTTGSTTVTIPPDEDVYVDPVTISATITGTTGGGILVAIDPAAAETVITDTIDVTTVTLSSVTDGQPVTEGGSITYTVTLGAPVTGSPLTVTLTNGDSVIIPVGESTGTIISTVRPDNEYVDGTETLTVSIASTSGGNYESLSPVGTINNTVVDDTDATTVTLSSATDGAAITEGGSITYTVTLGAPVTGSPLTVTLTNGDSVTIPVGESTGTIISTIRADNEYIDGTETLTVSIAGTSGGNYETLSPVGTVSNTVVDDTDATTVTLSSATAGQTITEGVGIIYTATVGSPVTGSDLIISLSNGQTITIPVGASTADSDPYIPRTDDAYLQGDAALTVSIDSTSGGNYEAVTTAGTISNTIVDDTDVTTVTLSSATDGQNVTEGAGIVYTATVGSPVTGSDLLVTLSNGVVITIPVGATTADSDPYIPRADDAYLQGDEALTVSIDSMDGGNYEALNPVGAVSNTIVDGNSATTVILSSATDGQNITEGAGIVYTATVGSPVTGSDLLVTLSNGVVITIPVGATTADSDPYIPRADDEYLQGDDVLTVGIASTSGGNYEALTPVGTVSNTVVDDTDATTVTLSSTTDGQSVTEGVGIVYTATVGSPVTGSDLVITLSNGQTITIPVGATTADSDPYVLRTDDAYLQGDAALTVSIANTSGGNYEAVTTVGAISNTIVDDADATTVTLSSSTDGQNITEGAGIVYTATVGSPVTGSDLVITLSNGQTVTIPVGATTADSDPYVLRPDNEYIDGTENLTVSIASTSGGNYESLSPVGTVNNTIVDDADATTVTLSSATAGQNITEGAGIVYTATVGSPVTGNDLIISLSNGQTITIPVGATTADSDPYVLRTDDAYLQGDAALTVSIANTSGGNYEAVTTVGAISNTIVDDADATTVTLSSATAGQSITEGVGIVYTAAVGSPVTGSDLVITLTNGQTITIPVGATTADSAPYILRADDEYLQGDAALTVSIASTDGGNYEQLTPIGTVNHTVVDDTDATTVTLSSSTAGQSVTEGAGIIYTATVGSPVTGSDLLVTLSNGVVITIPVGASTADSDPYVLRADDAYLQGDAALTVSIDTISGGNFETLNPVGTISNIIVDDTDATTVTLSSATDGQSVTEGTGIVYTATVGSPVTGSDLVITLSNGQTITIPVGATTADSDPYVLRPDNEYIDGTENLSVSIDNIDGGNYEALNAVGAVNNTIVDDSDATTVTLSSATDGQSVTEGVGIIYTATVGSPVTGSDLLISLSNGQTITIPVGATTADSDPYVHRADDAYLQGDAALTVSIDSTSGGNYEAVTAVGTVNHTVVDDNDSTTVTLSSATDGAAIVEGGSITYTVTLGAPVTGSPLTVTLTNGDSVTIPVGESTGTIISTVRPDNEYVDGTETLTVSIDSTSGGNYEAVTTVGTVNNTVVDDADATTVTLSSTTAGQNVAEGTGIIYTATVGSPVTGSDLLVNLSNGVVITIPVGATTADSDPYVARPDDIYLQGDTHLTVSIDSIDGGNFEATTGIGSISNTIVDDADATTVILSSSTDGQSVTEGTGVVYTATVGSPVTGSDLVITLTNGQTITIPVGATTADSDPYIPRADDVYLQGDAALTVSIASTSGGNYEAVNTFGSISNIIVDDADVTTVTLSSSTNGQNITEGGSIVYTASVTSPVTGSPLILTLSNGAIITIPVGASSADSDPVPVRADDAYLQGDQALSVTIASTSGGDYEAVTTVGTVNNTVVDDNDSTTVTLSSTTDGQSVTEGVGIVYTATVGSPVTGSDLVITLSNGQTITIPVGATTADSDPYVLRADDAYLQGDEALTVSIDSTSGGNYEALTPTGTVSNTVVDGSDVTTVTLSSATDGQNITEGTGIVYTATVGSPVTGSDLVITLSNGQTITIPVGDTTADSDPYVLRADDAYLQGDEALTVSIDSTSGGNYEAVTTVGTINNTVVDDTDATTVTLSSTTDGAAITEGGSITYTVTLGAPVTGSPLTVTLTNGDSVTIPVGESTGTIISTIRADNEYIDGTETLTVSIASTSGGNYETLAPVGTVSNTVVDDTDATTVTLSSATAGQTLTEGVGIIYTATVGSPVTGSDLIISLSNGQTITIPVGASTADSDPYIPRADDAYLQGDEALTVSIDSTSGGNYEAVATAGSISNTIVDDADVTTVSISGSTSTDEGDTASYTVSLTGEAQLTDVVVTLSYSGTAIDGTDYNGVTTVTIPAGSSSVDFDITTVDDLIAEGNENFTVTIVSAVGGNFENLVVSATNQSVTTTIVDNEPVPELRVEVNDALNSYYLNEASGFAHFTVSLSYASGADTTVSLALTDGTATGGGVDYGSAGANNLQVSFDGGTIWTNASSATIPAGSTGFVVRTPVIDDLLNEFNETFSLTATTTAGATSNPSATASTTIFDNDFTAPNITINNVNVNEADGSITFTVSLSAESGKPVSVDYATRNGSATAGSDYTAGTGTLNFAPGETSQTITIPITEDMVFEGNENFFVDLSNAVNAQITVPTGTGTIIDNEVAPAISVDNVSVAEDGGYAVFTVTQSGLSSTNTNFWLALNNGTATLGQDYTSAVQISTDGGANWTTTSSGSIPAGSTSVLVRVPVINDNVNELDETFTLTANVTSGNTSNTSATGTATIIDNDGLPSLSINDISVNEAAGTATFTVTLSAASGQTVSVNYSSSNGTATAGSDYTVVTGTLTFTPGQTTQTITVPIANDTIFEGNETFNVNLSGATNATIADNIGVGTIVDNDAAPTIATVSTASVTEGGNLVHTVTLSNASSTSSTFAYSLTGTTATAGSDFNTNASFSNGVTLSGGILTVPAGVTSFTVTYATIDDALDEPNETTALTVGGITGVGTIIDNDATPSLSINDISVNEAAGTATFTVTLSAASGQTVSVNYATSNGTATAGSDYTATSGTLTFTPGQTTQTITVPITNDTIFEGNETFSVNLSGATNATISDNTGVGTIIDNDAAPTIANVSAASVTEGGNLVHTVTLSNASSTSSTFAYSLTGTTATAGTDFSTAATFSNGVSLSGGILTVPAGVTSFTVTYATIQDTLDETNETTALTIGGVTGVGTIIDNDPTPSLSINDVSVNEAAGTATFTVTLSAASGQTVSVNYATSNGTATAGSDYTAASGTLTFNPGQTTQTITVPITNDTLAEPNETFNINLSGAVNATIADSLGVGTILDNDQPPSIDLDANNSTAAGNNYVTTYTENGAGVSIADTDILITDVDSTNLASATITLTNAQAGDVLSVGTLPSGITASITGNVVTLSGSASLANYQTAIRAITFSSTSEDPSTTPRTINVVVSDGQTNSNTAVATISVIAVNDAPVGVADVFNGANSVVEGTTVVRGNVLANDTDVDSANLTVAQFATNSGATATNANGSNSVTTALGGTVVVNADGTFTYTAPVRNHADAISDVDSFVYRASDGSLDSAWTTVTINVTDSAPVANPDTDSVGIGFRNPTTNSTPTITGNVITGDGGTGGADTLGADAARVSSVVFNGTTYNLGAGNTTIATTNGALVINETGSYSYTSAYQNKVVSPSTGTGSGSGTTAATIANWNSAGITMFGFDGSSPMTSGNSVLNLNALTAAASNIVRYRNNSGSNNDGIGVETNSGSSDNNRIENNEHLVLNLNMLSRSTSVTLTDLGSGESAQWRAYDASGALVASGSISGASGNIVTGTVTSTTAFQYLVFSGSSSSNFRVNGLTATPDLSNVTPDQFTYTLTDADGSSSTTTLTISTDSNPVAVSDSAIVYESGLSTGTQAGVLPTVATGNLLANDAGISTTTTITSVNGVTGGSGSTITISNAIGTLVVDKATGAYTYTLNGATTEGVNDTPTFNYVLTDSATGQTTNANLVINIVDDVPVGNDIVQTLQAASAVSLTYNLVIILDRSGSMAWDANGLQAHQAGYDPTTVRMDIAKDALAKLIDRYDGLGNVNVKIIDFSSSASGSAAVNETNWYIDDKSNAVSYIDSIQSSGGTEYSTALTETINGFTQPAADKTLFYFITDGEPSAGFEVGSTLQTQWQNFVSANGDIAFGIGIGSASLNALLPIAYPNVDADGNGVEDYAIKVTNASDLADTLLATVDGGIVAGNLSVLSGSSGTSGFLLGADGGILQSIVVDGVAYTYDGNGPSEIVIHTNKGGQLTVDFLTGSYSYELAVNKTIQNQQEVFQVTAVDGDGDSKIINLTVNLDYVAILDANRDTILTNVQAGTPITVSADALMHNDTMGGNASVTSAQGAVNGTVGGTTNVTYVPNASATAAAPIRVTQEALLDTQNNGPTPINDDRANAFLLARDGFGTTLPGGQAWAVDVAGYSQVFRGRIDNRSTGSVRDLDYVKVALFSGERIFIDVDNQSRGIRAFVEYYDANGVLQTFTVPVTGTGNNLAPNGYFTAPTDGEFFIRLQSDGTGTTNNTNYDLIVTLDQVKGPLYEAGQFDYTITENGVTSSATADVFHVAGNAINGTDADEILLGGGTNDILRGGGGDDVLIGGNGNDQLFGGSGNDRLEGGAGNDTLDGGAGNDILIGGTGNDTLTGGLGADVFKWSLADAGTAGAPAQDVITDFDTVAGGDKLDLRDLLQGEISQGVGANLENYLHFEKAGADTIVHVSSNGGFNNGYNPSNEVQTITLQNVDLVGSYTNDQQIIQNLLDTQKLVTD